MPRGEAAAPNGANGIVIGVANATIGGAATIGFAGVFNGIGNVISGNGLAGIAVTAPGVTVEGNFIGTDLAGTSPIGNGHDGIDITAPGATIGGSVAFSGNVISGNGGSGVFFEESAISPATSVIQDNFIGLNSYGTAALGNGASLSTPYHDGITAFAPGDVALNVGGDGPFSRNVISGNHGAGISISSYNERGFVAGNYIGTDPSGNNPMGNTGDGILLSGSFTNLADAKGLGNLISANGGDGVRVLSGSTTLVNETIGANAAGTLPLGNSGNGIEARNAILAVGGWSGTSLFPSLICGNRGDGILVVGGSASIQGSYIGVSASGFAPIGNGGNGIEIRGAAVGIGGPVLSPSIRPAGNVISASGGDGILIVGTRGAIIANNHIGTGRKGGLGLGNGGDGIALYDCSNTTIGAAYAPQSGQIGNLIVSNRHNGITITGSLPDASGNLIAGNAIYANNALGIDLGDDGVTPNHAGGAFLPGPNGLQNFPLLASATTDGTKTVVQGVLDSPPGNYRVEFFANEAPDPSGYGQGEQYVFAMMVSGGMPFTANLPALNAGTAISATATAGTDTSEFSRDVLVATQPPPRVTSASFDYQSATPSLSFTFTKDVSASLSLSDLQAQSGSGAAMTPVALSYDRATNTATFALPGGLADGNYQATLLGVTDAGGNRLTPNAADGNYTFRFFSLAGDVNHDGAVDFTDLVILARHYGQSGAFADGDLNHDGRIDFDDLKILARAFGHRIVQPASRS